MIVVLLRRVDIWYLSHCTYASWMFFPEEKKMLETLTRNQLLPIALPSALSLQKSSRKCWHQKPLDVRNPDVDMAIKAIDWVREQPHLKALPIFTFGLSSGGSFAALLGGLFPERIAGVASFISVGSAPFYRSVKSQESVPMVMVLMQRDSAMMERSDKALQMCQENKKHCHRFTVASHNLDANSFTFEPLMTSAESKAVFERLQETSMLDPESGAALTSVSPSDLAPLLPDILCPQYAGVESQSLVNKAALPMDISEEPILRKFHLQLGLIKQVINRAFGFHEASAEHFADAMAWLWDHKAH